jgi:hypothetical protein
MAGIDKFGIKEICPTKPGGREKVRELVEHAQKRSPVFDLISHPIPVEVSLQE